MNILLISSAQNGIPIKDLGICCNISRSNFSVHWAVHGSTGLGYTPGQHCPTGPGYGSGPPGIPQPSGAMGVKSRVRPVAHRPEKFNRIAIQHKFLQLCRMQRWDIFTKIYQHLITKVCVGGGGEGAEGGDRWETCRKVSVYLLHKQKLIIGKHCRLLYEIL